MIKKLMVKLLAGMACVGMCAGGSLMTAMADEAVAPEPLKAVYSTYQYGQGWKPYVKDNMPCLPTAGTYITGMRASLENQPEGMSGTIAYKVNLSGSGWLDWVENTADSNQPDTDMPLEAISVKLTGQLEENYDIYYKVLQNGAWTEWAMNGAEAGASGVGQKIDGIRISAVVKGGGEPEDSLFGAIDPNRPMVALTFDDGPQNGVTNRILASLAANGGRATFFMVGSRVPGHDAYVQQMAAQGCEVANHTYDHKYLTSLSADGILSQVGSTNQVIANASGATPVLMRPCGGYYNAASLETLGTMGMPAIMWSIDTRDWKTRNAQSTINAVLNNVRDGDIVLMHDLYTATADAAETIIPALTSQGYQLVTVSELAAYRGGMAPGHVYSSFRR